MNTLKTDVWHAKGSSFGNDLFYVSKEDFIPFCVTTKFQLVCIQVPTGTWYCIPPAFGGLRIQNENVLFIFRLGCTGYHRPKSDLSYIFNWWYLAAAKTHGITSIPLGACQDRMNPTSLGFVMHVSFRGPFSPTHHARGFKYFSVPKLSLMHWHYEWFEVVAIIHAQHDDINQWFIIFPLAKVPMLFVLQLRIPCSKSNPIIAIKIFLERETLHSIFRWKICWLRSHWPWLFQSIESKILSLLVGFLWQHSRRCIFSMKNSIFFDDDLKLLVSKGCHVNMDVHTKAYIFPWNGSTQPCDVWLTK